MTSKLLFEMRGQDFFKVENCTRLFGIVEEK